MYGVSGRYIYERNEKYKYAYWSGMMELMHVLLNNSTETQLQQEWNNWNLYVKNTSGPSTRQSKDKELVSM